MSTLTKIGYDYTAVYNFNLACKNLIVSAPSLECGVLESANGFITVTWHYNHTGGLPITNISVSYNVYNGESNTTSLAETESDTTAVKVQDLKLGFEYVFNISARNNHGSTIILCGPILYVTGEYTLI